MTRILELKEVEQNFPPIDLGLAGTTVTLTEHIPFAATRAFPYQVERNSKLERLTNTDAADPYNLVVFNYGRNVTIARCDRGRLFTIAIDDRKAYHSAEAGYLYGRIKNTRTQNLIEPVNIEKAKIGLHQIMHRLRKFADLEDGWDTYDAKPIERKTINRAIEFFCSLLYKNNYKTLPIPFVTPLNDGGIHFEWKTCFKEFHHTIPENELDPYTFYKLERIAIDKAVEEEKETYDINEIVNIISNWLYKE